MRQDLRPSFPQAALKLCLKMIKESQWCDLTNDLNNKDILLINTIRCD